MTIEDTERLEEICPDPYGDARPQTNSLLARLAVISDKLHGDVEVMRGRFKFLANTVAIKTVPFAYDAVRPKYKPLNGTGIKTASQTLNSLSYSTDLESFRIVARVITERITEGKTKDPDFLMEDLAMEWLRRALFMVDVFGMEMADFCEAGVALLTDMKKYVAEYEAKKSIGS